MKLRSKPHILIADDQVHVLETLSILLSNEGYSVTTISEVERILPKLQDGNFDLVLMDMNYRRDTTSGQDGIELLGKISSLSRAVPVVVMTAWGSTELAVQAMKNGASDFVEKPWDNHRLLSIIHTQLKLVEAKQQNEFLKSIASLDGQPDALIAGSKAMQSVMELVGRVAPSDASVLLCGESGTGKNLIARLIHRNSPVADMPFVNCNLGALAESVFESELFGHVKGAFTDAKSDRLGRFAMADGGTLFLDEITNTPIHLQNKLLQVIETGSFEMLGSSRTIQVNARLITASNVDFKKEIEAGRFREDLFYRINTVRIDIPPLRQRPEDILTLAEFYLAEYGHKHRRPEMKYSAQALSLLQRYHWPGNVRELAHVVERSVLVAGGDTISASDLGITKASSADEYERMTLEEAERRLIERAIRKQASNISAAAQQLGLSRSALYRRLIKYGIVPEESELLNGQKR